MKACNATEYRDGRQRPRHEEAIVVLENDHDDCPLCEALDKIDELQNELEKLQETVAALEAEDRRG